MVKRLCHIPYYKDSSQKMKSIFGLKPLHVRKLGLMIIQLL